jgi:hypothetical protein
MLIGALAEELPQLRSRSGGGSKVVRRIGRRDAATHRQRYRGTSCDTAKERQHRLELQRVLHRAHHSVQAKWASHSTHCHPTATLGIRPILDYVPQLCNVAT